MQRGPPVHPQSSHTPLMGVGRPLKNHCEAEQPKRAAAVTGTPQFPLKSGAASPKATPHPASAAGAATPVSPDSCAPDVAPLPAFFLRIRSSSCRTCSRRLRRSALAPAGMGGSWASWASVFTLRRRHRSPARSSWVGKGHSVRAGLAHWQKPQKNGAESQACPIPAAGAWLSLGGLCRAVSPHPVPGRGSGWCWPGGPLPGPARVAPGDEQWPEARGWWPARERRNVRCAGNPPTGTPSPVCPPTPALHWGGGVEP